MNHDEEPPKWREDFPYESEDDDYVTRRDFARFLVVVSGGLAAGNGVVYLRSRQGEQATFPKVEIARASDLSPGTATVVHYPDESNPAVLIRREDGELVAFYQKCTHLGCPVSYQSTREGQGEGECLACHCHNGRFDAASGQGTSGPPRELRPLERIALEIDGDRVFAHGLVPRRRT